MSLNKRLINTGGSGGGPTDGSIGNMNLVYQGPTLFIGRRLKNFAITNNGTIFNAITEVGYKTNWTINAPYEVNNMSYISQQNTFQTNQYGMKSMCPHTSGLYMLQASDFFSPFYNMSKACDATTFTWSTSSTYNPIWTNTYGYQFMQNFDVSQDGFHLLGPVWNLNTLYKWTLSTAYNPNTVSLNSTITGTSLGFSNLRVAIWNGDGTKLTCSGYVSGTNTRLRQFDILTPYDLNTIDYSSVVEADPGIVNNLILEMQYSDDFTKIVTYSTVEGLRTYAL